MPDQFTEVTRTGWGKNILNSIVGIGIGIIMFIASFVVLWTNEGRVNLGKIAATSTVIDLASDNAAAEGKLVALTGIVTADTPLGDPEYLKPGAYIALDRNVEMFAWIEEKETKEEKKAGGSTETKTTYTYKKTWTDDPEETSEFRYPEGHANPVLTIRSRTFTVGRAAIGKYGFDPAEASLPEADPVILTGALLIPTPKARLTGDDYLYIGKGSLDLPQLGDIRISFNALRAGLSATLLGKKQGTSVTAYYHKEKSRLFRLFRGTREDAIVTLKTEHKIMGWILRIVGFLLMWIGMTMVLGPIGAVLDVLPFLGKIGRSFIGCATFVVALILSLITIGIAMVAHNIIALVVCVAAALVLIFVLSQRRKAGLTNQP